MHVATVRARAARRDTPDEGHHSLICLTMGIKKGRWFLRLAALQQPAANELWRAKGCPQGVLCGFSFATIPRPDATTPSQMLSRCLRSASLALLLLGADALRVSPTRARGLRMTETAVKLSIEEAAAVFGRLADSQHVYKEPIRTAASGFEFSR